MRVDRTESRPFVLKGSTSRELSSDCAHGIRMLENLSRKTLRELTQQYTLKAKAAMHQESQQALDQNETLQEDLDDRSLAVTNMMSEHHDNDNVLRKMRIERDLIVSTTALVAFGPVRNSLWVLLCRCTVLWLIGCA